MFDVLLVGMPIIWGNMLLQTNINVWSVRYYLRKSHQQGGHTKGAWPLFGVITILMLGSFLQIALWGTLFLLLGEFQSIEVAIYHSGVNFSTLGYGDLVMSEKWRLLGPIEAINGALMISLSGATMLALLHQQLKGKFEGL
ncbi:MAG: ion channel [Shewanella sp.]|uniref:ion channel n=1 Tax=Aeromonas TaxID=642 RepID=UPI0028A3F821|nr:two pore domain potassium channel family protein [Aeromonas veronii]ELV7510617.1 two pore domain potassium channel family protein [Aeromonas veronii]